MFLWLVLKSRHKITPGSLCNISSSPLKTQDYSKLSLPRLLLHIHSFSFVLAVVSVCDLCPSLSVNILLILHWGHVIHFHETLLHFLKIFVLYYSVGPKSLSFRCQLAMGEQWGNRGQEVLCYLVTTYLAIPSSFTIIEAQECHICREVCGLGW